MCMVCWFRRLGKKKEEVEKQAAKLDLFRKTKLAYSDPTPFEVGKTTLRLTFEDGKHFLKTVTGNVWQYTSSGSDGTERYEKISEPTAHEPRINSSLDVARNFLLNFQTHIHEQGYTNDDLNPTETKVGKVVHVKILKTASHFEDFVVITVVPKEEK